MVKGVNLAQLKHKVEKLARQKGLSLDSIASKTGSFSDSLTLSGDPVLKITDDATREASFDTWYESNKDRPSLLIVSARAITDGVGDAHIDIWVDNDIGQYNNYDREYTIAYADANATADDGNNVAIEDTATVFLPAGSQWQVLNDTDPTGNNFLNSAREVVL